MEPSKNPEDNPKPEEDANLEEAIGKLDPQDILQIKSMYKNRDITKQDKNKPRMFWDTQPVPKIDEYKKSDNLNPGPIDEKKKPTDVPQKPYNLPDKFEWSEIDLTNEEQIKEVYELLKENYVEDDDNMFRFDYSIAFLQWALMVPGYYKDWIIGVRVIKSQKLTGFITGIPVHLFIDDKKIKLAEIRLAPVLIKEITRKIYTAGVELPAPIGQAQYFHRSLNPKKLIECNFSSLGVNQTMARIVKLYKLPNEPKIPGIRPMKKHDICKIHKLTFKIHVKYTEEEIKHFFMPRENVIYTYVVETKKNVTDFLSFYSLPSSILKHPKHTQLKAAYSFYNVATSVNLVELMQDALILAKNQGFDVFNALDIMDNKKFIEELKFSPGDGYLHYYLYNWKLDKECESKDLGIVLV